MEDIPYINDPLYCAVKNRRMKGLRSIVEIARMVAYSPPRSAQLVRLVSKLKEKIEELDKEQKRSNRPGPIYYTADSHILLGEKEKKMKIVRKQFKDWLVKKYLTNPKLTVGMRNHCTDCPIARFLDGESVVPMRDKLPKWAYTFIRRVDNEAVGVDTPISAKEALSILKKS